MQTRPFSSARRPSHFCEKTPSPSPEPPLFNAREAICTSHGRGSGSRVFLTINQNLAHQRLLMRRTTQDAPTGSKSQALAWLPACQVAYYLRCLIMAHLRHGQWQRQHSFSLLTLSMQNMKRIKMMGLARSVMTTPNGSTIDTVAWTRRFLFVPCLHDSTSRLLVHHLDAQSDVSTTSRISRNFRSELCASQEKCCRGLR